MVRWGILGAGKIAHRFADSLAQVEGAQLCAISCRSEQKAQAFTELYGVQRAYTQHERLLDDSGVDAIYLALPHDMHCEWANKAMLAGKAVLCEKPAAINAAQVRSMASTAESCRVLFMEAMKTRFVPLYGELKSRVLNGEIGELTRVTASFCGVIPDDVLRNSYCLRENAGGCLLDAGIYCASWIEDFLGSKPTDIQVRSKLLGGFEVYANAEMRFGSRTAALECAFDRARPRTAELFGTAGRIVVEQQHRAEKMTVFKPNAAPLTIEMPYIVDDFYGQIMHFCGCFESGKISSDIMPPRASIGCAEIIDSIKAAMPRG